MCQQRASDPYAGMKSFISYFPQSCHYPYLLALAVSLHTTGHCSRILSKKERTSHKAAMCSQTNASFLTSSRTNIIILSQARHPKSSQRTVLHAL